MGGLNRFFAVLTWPLLLAGIGAFGLGGWVLLDELRKSQAAAQAPQPAAVAIERFDPAEHIQGAGEVHVSGQLDLSMQYDLVASNTAGGGDYLGVMIPLYALGADSTGGPALGVLLYDQGPGGDTIGETEVNTLIAQIDGEGAVGPSISVAGRAVSAGLYRPLVLDAFVENGRGIDENFLTIAPFRAGRTTEFAYRPALEQPMSLGMGGTIAVLLAMIGFARRKRVRSRSTRAEVSERATEAESDPVGGIEGGPNAGLVFIPAYGPEMADGSTGTALMREVLALGRRSDETGVFSARRDGIDDFAALDSGGLKRPLAGRAVSEKIAGPKPVKKESPLAAWQDPNQAADIMAAVQAQIKAPEGALAKGDAGDIFAAVQAAVGSGRL